MKNFLTIAFAVIAAFMFVSCSSDKNLDDLIDTGSNDTADTNADTTDTNQGGDTNADTADSNADTGDTNADTADSNADSGDSTTDTGDSGADTGNSDNDGDNTDSGNNSDNDSTDSDNDDDTDSDSDDVEISDNDQENSGEDNDSTDSGSDNDSGDSDNDSDSTDSGNDSDADNPETPDSDCVGISIDWNSFVLYEGAFSADAIIGDPDLEDGFSIEFDHNPNGKVNIGQYDLGETKTKNRQYLTCEECVMVYMDCEVPYVFYPDNCAAYFFQESGTLNVTANDDATDKEGNIEGTLSAKLIEVELSGTEYDIDSTPVTNGRCVEIESGGTFQSTRDCLEINLTNTNLTYNSSTKRYETSYSPNTGNFFTNDTFTMQLRNFNSSVENYSLAGTNYGDTNGIFFVVYEDNGSKYYFQKKGTINYDASAREVQLNGVMLEEVTFTNSPKSSVMVPYGSCLKVKDTTLSY
ncbi:hypothetical protein J5681_07650 [bacterium]|nr:hypothetical protein [bacterium]